MIGNPRENLGRLLKERRLTIPLTLEQLSAASGVSISHLDRIEIGDRFPSATVLRKIAKPLGYEENELFILAGYLTPKHDDIQEERQSLYSGNVASDVLMALAQEPVEIQRATIEILKVLKSISTKTPKRRLEGE